MYFLYLLVLKKLLFPPPTSDVVCLVLIWRLDICHCSTLQSKCGNQAYVRDNVHFTNGAFTFYCLRSKQLTSSPSSRPLAPPCDESLPVLILRREPFPFFFFFFSSSEPASESASSASELDRLRLRFRLKINFCLLKFSFTAKSRWAECVNNMEQYSKNDDNK